MRSYTGKKYSIWQLTGMLLGCMLLLALAVPMRRAEAESAGIWQVDPASDSITVQWNSMGDEDTVVQYNVYVGTSAQDAVLFASFDSSVTTATVSGLAAGSTRYIKVTYDYWNPNQTRYYTKDVGYLSNARTTPAKVKNVRQDKWYLVARVFWARWDKLDSVDGYEYEVRTSGGKSVAKGTVAGPAVKVGGISNQKIYTVRARGYVDIAGQRRYGTWSGKIYCFTQPQVNKAAVSADNKLTVKWDKVSGATGYEIYVSTKKTSGYKKVKTVDKSKTSATISKVNGKAVSAKRKYYVYVVAKKKVGTKTYRSGKLRYWNTKNTSVGYF